ncbi:hypothetical protein QNA08_00970 [Chelatococcus sp. SYSU_G07232]|uniref:Uncharacterized protein n=2 Tax=Chelatococcus albus TaxID=3047466 RepID=A0ABT7ABT0_9HYPH|nr:hypothetical protein [Chelatococcus sp. SYSU_G07232]
MPTSEPFISRPGTLSGELISFIRDLRVALRLQMQQSFPDAVPEAPSPLLRPRVIDKADFDAAVAEAKEAAKAIDAASEEVVAVVAKVEGHVREYLERSAKTDDLSVLQHDGVLWACEEMTTWRREAQFYLHELCLQAATLQIAVQRTLGNIEFIHVCAPHPCDDPHAEPWTVLARAPREERRRRPGDEGEEQAPEAARGGQVRKRPPTAES